VTYTNVCYGAVVIEMLIILVLNVDLNSSVTDHYIRSFNMYMCT